jgi:alkaline phosphatase D
MNRREFLKATAVAPFLLQAQLGAEEAIPWSAVGDVSPGLARLVAGGLGGGLIRVDWKSAGKAGHATGTKATLQTDNTAQVDLSGLPAGQIVTYRAQVGANSTEGLFRTPPGSADQPVTFLWGGDVVGQGWGIDPDQGGMLTFQSMAREKPHFFIHSGDSIYADDPLPKTVEKRALTWKNIVTPAKSKKASSLRDYYGNYRYNFIDPHYRKFFSEVAVIAQWDDHEVWNNWNPRDDARRAEIAFRAFSTYWPIRSPSHGRLYRKIGYGPNVDVFVLDLRSHRAPNGQNRQSEPSDDTALLGRKQLNWLKQGLVESRATWKIVAGEMPIATHAPKFGLDSWANGPGGPLGREWELAELLEHGLENGVKNVVWLAADVHYSAAFHFHPKRAAWKRFHPFWEFIAGPLHAGTFAPTHEYDPTFGPEEVFLGVPRDLAPNRPPSENLQFYGKVRADAKKLRVSLHQREGREIYSVSIPKL